MEPAATRHFHPSVSDSQLIRKATAASTEPVPPSQPQNIKPFILRSTSPRQSARGVSSIVRIAHSAHAQTSPQKRASRKVSTRSLARLPNATAAKPHKTTPVELKTKHPFHCAPVRAASVPRPGTPPKPVQEWDSVTPRGRKEGPTKNTSLGDLTNRTPERSRVRTLGERKMKSLSPEKRRPTGSFGGPLMPRAGIGKEMDLDGERAYSSLQDMLELSGFTDTRVITPTAAVRKAGRQSVSSSIPPTPATTPPLRPTSLRAKPSLLSLALSSLWPRAPTQNDTSTVENEGESDDGYGSDDTIHDARQQRAQAWVSSIAQDISVFSPPPIHTLLAASASTASRSSSISPRQPFSSPPSSVDYDSGLSVSSTSSLHPCPPTPPMAHHASARMLTPRKSSDPITTQTTVTGETNQSFAASNLAPPRLLRTAKSSPALAPSFHHPSIFQAFSIPPLPSHPAVQTADYSSSTSTPPEATSVPRLAVPIESSRSVALSGDGSWAFSISLAAPALRHRASEAILGWTRRPAAVWPAPPPHAPVVHEKQQALGLGVPRLLRKGSALLRPSAALLPVLTVSEARVEEPYRY